jgi:hypothetical protein
MPKAPIHKYRYFFFFESEVWLAGEGEVPAPTGDFIFLKQFN